MGSYDTGLVAGEKVQDHELTALRRGGPGGVNSRPKSSGLPCWRTSASPRLCKGGSSGEVLWQLGPSTPPLTKGGAGGWVN